MKIEKTIQTLHKTNSEVWLEGHYGKVVVCLAIWQETPEGRSHRIVFRSKGFHVEG